MSPMHSVSMLQSSSSSRGGSIVRSRSRYKGTRPNQTFTTFQEPRDLASKQLQEYGDPAPRTRERQPSGSTNRMPTDHVLSPNRNSQTRAADLEGPIAGATKSRNLDRELKADPGTEQGETTANIYSVPPSRNHGLSRVQPDHVNLALSERTRELQARSLKEQSALKRPSVLTRSGFTHRIAGEYEEKLRIKNRDELKKKISAPVALEPPISMITPAFDAPISAVNAGERRVNVNYEQTTISLPVTPSTTPQDIIRLASEQIPDSIDPRTMILIESYRQLGLERPLRRYERIRDILNSWDNDKQNTLLIVPSPTGNSNNDLELDSVSRSQPGGTSVSLQHSQRPGHWDKRWVSLRTDGQVVVAKKDGGETSNICHLSDFDIYTPTKRQLSKRIKPPRKLCFTVKSQQKSSMFMSTVNFVHFFSTNDKTTAVAWYRAVQGWRSWYLVNILGNGQRESHSLRQGVVNDICPLSAGAQPELREQSTGSEDWKTEVAHKDGSQRSTVHGRGAPPSLLPRKFNKDRETEGHLTDLDASLISHPSSSRRSEPGPFVATTLLGKQTLQRQKGQVGEGAQIEAHPVPTSSEAGVQSGSLKRASSRRQKIRPLVDLTPQYQEPPQHARKGKGIVPEQIPAGGLVEIATSPEAAVEVPPASTWHKSMTSGKDNGRQQEIQRLKTISRKTDSGHPSPIRKPSTALEQEDTLLSGGLPMGEGKCRGDTGTARSIMTGDRHTKTRMLKNFDQPNLAPGSLLERTERYDSVRRPVDAGKRR